jgi:hypothetical protein
LSDVEIGAGQDQSEFGDACNQRNVIVSILLSPFLLMNL